MTMKIVLYRDGVADPERDIVDPTDFLFGFDEPPLDGVTFEAGEQISARLISDESSAFTTEALAVTRDVAFLSPPIAGFPVEIQTAQYSGTPAAKVTPSLELNSVDVTGDLPESKVYQVPEGTSGQSLAYSESAGNNVVDEGGDPILASPSVSVTVLAATAPSADTEPSIENTAVPGNTVTIMPGTYSGVPDDVQVTGVLTLNGNDVTANLVGQYYTIPASTVGQVLEYTETGSNGVSPDATQSVSVTISVADFAAATGGVEETVGNQRLHKYYSRGSAQIEVTNGGTFNYEVIGAGDAGGSAESGGGGGGSAGDVIQGSVELSPGTYDMTVGVAGTESVAATQSVLFISEAFEVTALPGGQGGGRSPTVEPADGGGGYGGAGGGSNTGAAHPTSFKGGNGSRGSSSFGDPEFPSDRNGGGGRGAGGDGTDATISESGTGGPGVISIAPGVSEVNGKGGDGGMGRDSEGGIDGVNFGDGGSGTSSDSSVNRDPGNGGQGAIRIWYEVAL